MNTVCTRISIGVHSISISVVRMYASVTQVYPEYVYQYELVSGIVCIVASRLLLRKLPLFLFLQRHAACGST